VSVAVRRIESDFVNRLEDEEEEIEEAERSAL